MPTSFPIHFISGLPRSGSILRSALLRQNPALHANITSPIGSMVGALLADMSAGNETSAALDAVYAFTGLPSFRHDPKNVHLDVGEFDSRLGTPGLHHVRPQAARIERQTLLPPDLWQRYVDTAVWRHPDFNTRGVTIAGEPPPQAPNAAASLADAVP